MSESSSNTPMRQWLHEAHCETMRPGYYELLKSDPYCMATRQSADIDPAWKPVCDSVLQRVVGSNVALGSLEADEAIKLNGETIDHVMANGLCDDLPTARAEVGRLALHAYHASRTIHATDDQRTKLQGNHAHAGEAGRVRGRFSKKFRPEGPNSVFEEIRRDAELNYARLEQWADGCAKAAYKSVWRNHAALNHLKKSAETKEIPHVEEICHAVQLTLSQRHEGFPPFVDISDGAVRELTDPNTGAAHITQALADKNLLHDALSVALLYSVQDQFVQVIQEQMQKLWNSNFPVTRKDLGNMHELLMSRPFDLNEVRSDSVDPLGNISKRMFTIAEDYLEVSELAELAKNMQALRTSMVNNAIHFVREDAGRRAGQAI